MGATKQKGISVGKKADVHYEIRENKRSKRFTVFRVDPNIKGFGQWKIAKGGLKTKKEAKSWATARAGIEGLL